MPVLSERGADPSDAARPLRTSGTRSRAQVAWCACHATRFAPAPGRWNPYHPAAERGLTTPADPGIFALATWAKV